MKKITMLLVIGMLSLYPAFEGKAQYLNALGSAVDTEGGICLSQSMNSASLLVGGFWNDQAMVMDIPNSGSTPAWTIHFDVTGENDRVTDVKYITEASGTVSVIGSGRSGDQNNRYGAFAFRLDFPNGTGSTPTLTWVYRTLRPSNNFDYQGRGIHYHADGTMESLVLVVTVRDHNDPSDNKTNAGLIRLDLAGNQLQMAEYSNTMFQGQDDNFNGSTIDGDILYLSGRSNLDQNPSGLDDSRFTITSIDVSSGAWGSVIEANWFVNDLTVDVTEYGKGIIVSADGDDLISVGHTGYNGGSSFIATTNTDLLLVRKEIGSTASQFIQIDIPSRTRVQSNDVHEIVDINNNTLGVFIFGEDFTNDDELYLFKLMFDLPNSWVVDMANSWARSYTGFSNMYHPGNRPQGSIVDGNYFYFTGSAEVGGGGQVILGKVNTSDGKIFANQESCSEVLNFTVSAGVYSNSFNHSDPNIPLQPQVDYPSISTLSMPDESICEEIIPCDYTLSPTATLLGGCKMQFNAGLSGTWTGPFEYEWDFGNGLISNEANPTMSFYQPVASVTLTVRSYYYNGGVLECCLEQTSIQLPTYVPCDPCEAEIGFTYTEYCCGVVEYEAYGVPPGFSAFWEFGDGNTAAGNNVIHDYGMTSGSQTFVVKLIVIGEDEYGDCCTNETSQSVVIDCDKGHGDDPDPIGGRPAGGDVLNQVQKNQAPLTDDLTIYPNPTQDVFTVAFGDDVRNVKVFDATGRLVLSELVAGKTKAVFNLSAFENGIFMIVAEGDKHTVRKVIKQ